MSFHGLPRLLPSPSFSLHYWPSCSMPGLPVPISPTRQPGTLRLLLHEMLDGIPYFWCPPLGSEGAAKTGTRDLRTTAPRTFVESRCAKQSLFALNVSNLPEDLGEALSRVEDCTDRGFSQTFPIDLHCTYRSAKFLWLFSLQTDLTHHH